MGSVINHHGVLKALVGATFLTVLLAFGVASEAQAKRMTVAVMTFDNGSSDSSLDPLGKGLAAMLTTDLTAVGQFTLVERQRLADIKAELKLGKTKLMNKKTTAKVGKLVGASHLVTGAFTVSGNTMRLDCRMVEVSTGKVVTSEKVSGEKDAFFELEKDLVKKLVKATGVKLKAKERYTLGKVHTADFKAFEKFSQGLGYYDAKRYDQAVAAMQEASNLDGDFKLAKLSLEKYEELVAQSQNKADAAQVAAVEMARLKRDKKAAKEALLVSRLAALVKRRGTKSVDGMVATHILYDMYSGSWGRTFLRHLRTTGDQFAMQRTADQFAQSYWKHGKKRPGGLPPYITGLAYANPPATAAEFDAFFKEARKRAVGDGHIWARWLKNWHSFSGRLHMDGKTRSVTAVKLAKMGEGVVAGDCRYSKGANRKACVRKTDAKRWKAAAEMAKRWGQYDISTQAFAQASRIGKDPAELGRIARDVKKNRDIVKAYAAVPKAMKKYARSLLFVNSWSYRDFPKIFAEGKLGKPVYSAYRQRHKWSERELENQSFMLINGTPAYALSGHYHLWTGWRTDHFRSDRFRYLRARPFYRGVKVKERPLIIYGAQPSDGFEASFTVERALPAELVGEAGSSWDKLGDDGKRATVSFLFGLKDIKVTGETDTIANRRGTGSLPQPMHGYAVRLGKDTVKLVKFKQRFEDKQDRTQRTRRMMKAEFDDTVLATWRSRGVTQDRFKVKVAKRSGKVFVTVNGTTWSARVSSAVGFTGFVFEGTGYGGIITPRKTIK